MPTTPQDNFTIAAKKRLIELGWPVNVLVAKVGKSRTAVSMALNHPVYPTVRREIARVLKLREVKL
jgi:hypothetical protein